MITDKDLEKLSSKDPKDKYGFAKELLKISVEKPEHLYKYFDYWVELMRSDNNILKWTAIDIIGYLSKADKDNKIDSVLPEIISLLHCGNLITCNHSIFALGVIAWHKPDFKEKIINELISISDDNFDTPECKDIATGKVIEALKPYAEDIKNNQSVLEFIDNATKAERNATKKKAEKMLKNIEKLKM